MGDVHTLPPLALLLPVHAAGASNPPPDIQQHPSHLRTLICFAADCQKPPSGRCRDSCCSWPGGVRGVVVQSAGAAAM
jgi:hypothetical protein